MKTSLLAGLLAASAATQAGPGLFGMGDVTLPYMMPSPDASIGALLGSPVPADQTDLSVLTGESTEEATPGDGEGMGAESYTVVPGDSLSAIAARFCGDASAWPAIFEANRDQIRDPNLIYPGQTFRVPCGDVGAAASTPTFPPLDPASVGADILGPGRSFLTNLPLPRGSYRKSSGFGPRQSFTTDNGARASSDHQGVDLAAPSGTPIAAAGPGVVIHAGPAGGYGYAVYIRHANGMVTRYGHLRRMPSVRVGQRVDGGQQIGEVGSTGNSTGPHLHFEVREPNGTARNPEHFCRF